VATCTVKLNYDFTPANQYAPLTVNFSTGTNTNANPASYVINYGDGTSSPVGSSSGTHIYNPSSSTTYTATLTATHTASATLSCSDSLTINTTVKKCSISSFTATPSSGNEPLNASLNAVAGNWENGTADASDSRKNHSTVTYNNKMYIFGGKNGVTYLDTMRIYDFGTGTWSSGATDTGNPREGHSAVVANNKMYVFGGKASDTYSPILGSDILDKMRVYDFATNTWSAGIDYSGYNRKNHSAVTHNNKMYIFGGINRNGQTQSGMQIYDFATSSWTTGPAYATASSSDHSAIVYSNKMYLFGGINNMFSSQDGMKIFDFTTNTWSDGSPDTGNARSTHSANLYNNKMYIFGGAYSANLDTMRVYDFATSTWAAGFADSGNARNEHTAVTYNSKIYIFGGSTIYDGTSLNTMRVHNFGNNFVLDYFGDGTYEDSTNGLPPLALPKIKTYNTINNLITPYTPRLEAFDEFGVPCINSPISTTVTVNPKPILKWTILPLEGNTPLLVRVDFSNSNVLTAGSTITTCFEENAAGTACQAGSEKTTSASPGPVYFTYPVLDIDREYKVYVTTNDPLVTVDPPKNTVKVKAKKATGSPGGIETTP